MALTTVNAGKVIETMIAKGFPRNHSLVVKFQNEHRYADERLANIQSCLERGESHAIVIDQFLIDCGGFPCSDITTYYFEFDGTKYVEVETSDCQNVFTCVDMLY